VLLFATSIRPQISAHTASVWSLENALPVLQLKDDFPQVWLASWENRDLRQLLWHRTVQARRRMMNQLHAAAINARLRHKKRLC
jgi:hypothetical protein